MLLASLVLIVAGLLVAATRVRGDRAA